MVVSDQSKGIDSGVCFRERKETIGGRRPHSPYKMTRETLGEKTLKGPEDAGMQDH